MADLVSPFVRAVRSAMEQSPSLKRGGAFMPAYLKGWALSRELFSPVAKRVAKDLGWSLERERYISFPKEYDVWRSMRVDYAFDGAPGKFPKIFLELETLDRSQLFNFHPR